ncbi:hypothetical protein JTE90_024513 [Oedothorax gibbosus]|uniref:Uncharacterized protein n=1 Tax=Oedothorax gibbosus TaxID=931172 RepID=A0AAV6TQX5_9ARAC|nr:hypothetical protein JTE90_024513 [Oedothorax gibbosus]
MPTNMTYPEAMVKGYDLKFYRQLFEDIGFSVICCEMRPVIFSYESDEECKNLLLSLHYIGEVSKQLKEEYKEDIFRQFVKHSPRDSEGHPTHNAIILHAKLTKKKL